MRNFISGVDFAKIYNTSSSTEEVAQKTGMTAAAVASRAAHYRKKGAQLKRMGGSGRRVLDVGKINAALEEAGLLPPAEANGEAVPVEGVAVEAPRKKRVRKR